jgi:hypothetical protein
VNVGDIVFSVKRIDWDHWMWSLFLGVGCILWQHVIFLDIEKKTSINF